MSSTYELLDQAAVRNPERPALCSVLTGKRGDQQVSLTYRALLGKIRQTAHLLADLGVGPQDVIALLLPNLFEMPLLLWSGQAGGSSVRSTSTSLPTRSWRCSSHPFMTKTFVLHLMQLGLTVYVIGETTTREITGKDALVAV